MAIENVGFVGWRGMVGSVLMARMQAEDDFAGLTPTFYSTSQVGQAAPDVGVDAAPLGDAFDVDALKTHQVIVTCQGGDYTQEVLPKLRAAGWDGYWIDAASAKRMDTDSVIILDPVNRSVIDEALGAGVRNYVGGNCTVSLMLMALGGLFREGLVEHMTSMTYQAASGAGARAMRELITQMRSLVNAAAAEVDDSGRGVLALDAAVAGALRDGSLGCEATSVPLAGSLIPWIDRAMPEGDTREEWKGYVEANKILGTKTPIAIDGICVRVGAMRCHSQAFTIKLTKDAPLDELRAIIGEANEWVRVVENDKDATLRELTPTAVTGTLDVPVGRLRKLRLGPDYLGAFSVGDQLLWGAAEPLRRMLRILRSEQPCPPSSCGRLGRRLER